MLMPSSSASRDLAHWARQPGAVIASTLLFPS